MPKIKNNKGTYILSNKHYFNGIEAYREYQDHYSETVAEHFKILHRGIRFSKAKHLTIRQYYNLVNKDLDTSNLKQVIAKAKDHQLLEIKIKAIQKTLEVYKNYNSKNELMKESAILEAKNLIREVEQLKKDKEHYKEAISYISQQYRVPQYVIQEVVREVENINEKEL